MTKDAALDLALEALEKISRTHYHIETPPIESLEEKMRRIADKAITAIKQALAAPVQPVAWTPGPNLFKDWCSQYFGPDADDAYIAHAIFNLPPMAQRFAATPPAQPAPTVQPVAFEVGLVEWVGNKLMATPKVTTTPPASWVEMVTANLVREGVNKHKARELAEHFYGLAQRPFVGLTDEERDHIWHVIGNSDAHGDVDGLSGRDVMAAIEAKLRSKNNENTD